MAALAVVLSGTVGLVAGWFLPPMVYRFAVPADEPLRSTCGTCDRDVPWAGVRRRCPECGTAWGPPAWATGAIAGAAAAVVAYAVGLVAALPLYVALCVFAVLLGAIDIACKRLPHDLVIPAISVSVVLFGLVAAVTGEWSALVRAGIGAAVLGAVYFVLFLVARGGFGFGDVKLAVLLGLFLGWLGWRPVLLGLLLPPLLNAPVVIGLLVAHRVDRRGSVPYGPAMLTGAFAAIGMSGLINFVSRT